jgi:hypothetical protein
MKVNIENAVRQSCWLMKGEFAKGYAYTLSELIDNLKELKERHDKGESKEALDEFFNVYVFSSQPLPPKEKE